jgi:hypothetical protein
MPAAASRHRVSLLVTSIALYPAILAAFSAVERPGLGIGHFYYFPIAIVALAGPIWGVVAGIPAPTCYTGGIVLDPHLPTASVLQGARRSGSSRSRPWARSSAGSRYNRQFTGRLRVAEERDFVTGLLNTRAFDAAFSARAELGRPFGLVLADMDSLREINDGEGHAVGNDLLRLAGDILKRELGYGDHIARVGGDEFGIITSAGNRRGPCAL